MIFRNEDWVPEVVGVLLVVIAVLCALLYGQYVHAGGGQFEAPVLRGHCNPIVIPEDMKTEGWQWLKAHERQKIAAGGNEIQEFQTMYCVELSSTGGLVREYIMSAEWWRPRLKKPPGKARVTIH